MFSTQVASPVRKVMREIEMKKENIIYDFILKSVLGTMGSTAWNFLTIFHLLNVSKKSL